MAHKVLQQFWMTSIDGKGIDLTLKKKFKLTPCNPALQVSHLSPKYAGSLKAEDSRNGQETILKRS